MAKNLAKTTLDVSENIVPNLMWYKRKHGLSAERMCEVLVVSRSCYQERLKNPASFRLKEIALAAKYFKVSSESLLFGAPHTQNIPIAI